MIESIWKKEFTLEQLNEQSKNTLIELLGIRYTEFTHNSITAVMPVDHRTKQPIGVLHGGASVTLAETLGSLGAYLCTAENSRTLGLEINANHILSVYTGFVTGIATPLHIGRSTQIWQIHIYNELRKLSATSRLTVAVLSK